jgi:hypothetical protein
MEGIFAGRNKVMFHKEMEPWISGSATLKAVGWLDRSHAYARGEVTEAFFEALIRLLVDPWQPAETAGRHACTLCKFGGGPSRISFNGIAVTLGASNVFVPGDTCVYVSPSLIAHYVDAHEYCPPIDFVSAVLECLPMRSVGYLKKLKEGAGASFSTLLAKPIGTRA